MLLYVYIYIHIVFFYTSTDPRTSAIRADLGASVLQSPGTQKCSILDFRDVEVSMNGGGTQKWIIYVMEKL